MKHVGGDAGAPSATAARLWRIVFIGTLCAVLYLALRPAGQEADWFPNADKFRHVAAFVVLFGMGWRAGVQPRWALAAGLLLFGVGIEVAQSFTPSREASGADVAADLVGIAAGWLIQRLIRPAT